MESADWIDEKELYMNGISIPQNENIQALYIYSMIELFCFVLGEWEV